MTCKAFFFIYRYSGTFEGFIIVIVTNCTKLLAVVNNILCNLLT